MVKSTKNICRVLFFSGVLLVTSACSDSFCRRILRISLLKPLIGRPNRMH